MNTSLRNVSERLFLLALLVFAIGIVGALVVSYTVTTPIKRLNSNMLTFQKELYRVNENSSDGRRNGGDELKQLEMGFAQMAANLRKYLDELERLNEEKQTMHCMAVIGEMSTKIAHEVRNGLYSIRGAAQYLDKALDNELVHEYTRIIYESVESINKLTNSMLDFARPLKPNLKKCDLRRLIHKSVTLLKSDFEEKRIRLETKLGDSLFVRADENQINQVLMNLLLNAIDAVAEKGHICIQAEKKNGQVEVCIRDDGIGVPAHIQNEIFKPFVTYKSQGTGLGLSTVQKIVQSHRGRVWVKNNSDRGACFVFTLPVYAENEVRV